LDFDNLTKEQKIEYWDEVNKDIQCCVSLCEGVIPSEIIVGVQEYLSHNELGLALELLADIAIKNNLNLSVAARIAIINTFKKMQYHISEKEQYQEYEQWAKSI
jgi:hypothetical protein